MEPQQQEQALSTLGTFFETTDTAEDVQEEGEGQRNQAAAAHSSSSSSSIDDNDDEEEEEESPDIDPVMNLQELLYSSSSYYAIAKPVTMTMILAALAVVTLNDDATRAAGEAVMAQSYQPFSISSDNNSPAQNLAHSLANALVMVTYIGAMTFVIVLLYKFRCMTCLIGYMMLSSGMLLGMLGGNMLLTAVHLYRIPMDALTFYGGLYNFALVGVMAVFGAQHLRCIPKYITQAYLIATAVILAWHLSYFNDWMIWSLLCMLALYDLCAVLTPCGPLKALVHLMSQDEAPEMPGLLYEAELRSDTTTTTTTTITTTNNNITTTTTTTTTNDAEGRSPTPPPPPPTHAVETSITTTTHTASIPDPTSATNEFSINSSSSSSQNRDRTNMMMIQHDIPLAIARVYKLPIVQIPEASQSILRPLFDSKSTSKSASRKYYTSNQPKSKSSKSATTRHHHHHHHSSYSSSAASRSSHASSAAAPLLAAAASEEPLPQPQPQPQPLDLLDDHDNDPPLTTNDHEPPPQNLHPLLHTMPHHHHHYSSITAAQLQALVTVHVPAHGGRIEPYTTTTTTTTSTSTRRRSKVDYYLERDRHGQPKRRIWVDAHGKVFADDAIIHTVHPHPPPPSHGSNNNPNHHHEPQHPQSQCDDDEDEDDNEENEDDDDHPNHPRTIRLGLGDFIFYSVLVAKAAQYSFATFAACMLVILAGLGGTLLLLSMYHHALPALPISIVLGVLAYGLTRLCIEPWIEAVLSLPLYV